ncbi:hypothetical protein AGMMS50256_29460 [Betaproteobacteria bacterium]|nr:hypothetical protein AGMMS50256_29460 [Betaproteobacteria bacterium]
MLKPAWGFIVFSLIPMAGSQFTRTATTVCGGVERLALVRNGTEARPVDAEFEARWRLKN